MNRNSHHQNQYPFSTWLITIVASPIFWSIDNYIFRGEAFGGIVGLFQVIFLFIVMGVLLSLPTFLLTIGTYYILTKLKTQEELIQLINLILGVAGIIITFNLIGGTLITTRLILIYSITWALMSILFSPYKKSDL